MVGAIVVSLDLGELIGWATAGGELLATVAFIKFPRRSAPRALRRVGFVGLLFRPRMQYLSSFDRVVGIRSGGDYAGSSIGFEL